jgi:hypothetical protein
MTLKLSLPTELEHRLRREAQRKGVPAETCAMQVLDKCLPTQDQRTDAVALLQSWIDEADDTEQQETGNYLVQVLDEDRLSDRKLFPPELKGITW